jgi:heme/copper-type cytochrome/quinol oxidase subunit 1
LNILKQKPYHILLIIAAIITLLSIAVINPSAAIDIHTHDSYFIIAIQHIFWLVALVAICFWIMYFIFRKLIFSNNLTWIHVVVTSIALLILLLLVTGQIGNGFSGYCDINNFELNNILSQHYMLVLITGILLLAQLLFALNIFIGAFKFLSKKFSK